MASGRSLHALIVEDRAEDAELIELELGRGGFAPTLQREDTLAGLARATAARRWDVIFTDYSLPGFTAPRVLEVLARSPNADVPVIVVSGSIGEEQAVALLKTGAADFVVKTNLARLVPAVERELREAVVRRERRDALEGLRAAVKARDDFLLVASHELRSPLTTLKLQLGSLLRAKIRGPDGEKLHARLQTAARSTDRLIQLIERMLDINNFGGEAFALQSEELDLGVLIRDLVSSLEGARKQSGSELRVELPGSLPMRADPRHLQTALGNLLNNAIKFGQGRRIDLRVEQHGESVRITVADQGIGISPQDQARIFERFERAVSNRHYSGFGLGLWLTRQIVDAHGGEVSVQSAPGQGSTFRITLPRQATAGRRAG